MPNLEKYNQHLPNRLKLDLSLVLFSNANTMDENLELVITIKDEKINIKELSSFLELIYRFDGTLSELGFIQYSHYPEEQIMINEFRFGSWEIVIQETLHSINAEKIILIGLGLKYLPDIINSFMDVRLKYIDYKIRKEDYLEKKGVREKKEKREFRQEIRNSIKNDQLLSSLNKKKSEKLVNILDDLYTHSRRKLSAPSRFTQKSLKNIRLLNNKKK